MSYISLQCIIKTEVFLNSIVTDSALCDWLSTVWLTQHCVTDTVTDSALCDWLSIVWLNQHRVTDTVTDSALCDWLTNNGVQLFYDVLLNFAP